MRASGPGCILTSMDSLQRVLLLVITLLVAMPMASNTNTTTNTMSLPLVQNMRRDASHSSLRQQQQQPPPPLSDKMQEQVITQQHHHNNDEKEDECHTLTIHLNTTHIERDFVLVPSHTATTLQSSPMGPGTQQVGILPFVVSSSHQERNHNNKELQQQQQQGYYEVSITFLNQPSSPNDDSTTTTTQPPMGCIGVGAYTFLPVSPNVKQNHHSNTPSSSSSVDQITFTASCQGLPYLSITGGMGAYQGAYGQVHYNLPGRLPHTKRHEIHVCQRPLGTRSRGSTDSPVSSSSSSSS